MGLTVDDVMDKIGSFGRYQYRLLFIFGFMKIFGDGIQIMIPTFLSIEPAWQKMKSCDCLLSLKFQFVVPRGCAVLDVPVILKSILRKSTNLRRYKRVFFASL